MVAGKQAEIGILESPVIKCHKNTLPGIDSLHILTSLGPLPPYRIMARKTLSGVYKTKNNYEISYICVLVFFQANINLISIPCLQISSQKKLHLIC